MTTALGTRARLRARTGRRVARTPPTVTSRAAGQKKIALSHRSRGLIPLGPAASSPQRHQPFTLASRGFSLGGLSAATLRRRPRPVGPHTSPKPPHRLAREAETLFFCEAAATDIEAFASGPERPEHYSSSHGTPRILGCSLDPHARQVHTPP